MNFKEIADKVKEIAEKNRWYDKKSSNKAQTPKNIAISISLEAAELLENYQWTDVASVDSVKDELADIIIYSSYLASLLQIDINQAIIEKLEINHTRTWD